MDYPTIDYPTIDYKTMDYLTPFLYILLFLSLISPLAAQQSISGQVLDHKGEPVALANVFLKDIFDGGTTDEMGKFSFETQATDSVFLVVSHMSFEKFEQGLDMAHLPDNLVLNMVKGGVKVSPVVIIAGAFEASDEKKGTILKPLDIVQNAGAQGDIFGAIQTLPGVSPTANETGIFVRGGGAYETRTIIDGTIAPQPFFTTVPNIPSRGRFDPFLFKGTLFSTGGYSAEYGQALSSVLLLNTQDMPERTSTGIGVNLVGVDISHTHLWNNKSAFLVSGGVSYLDPYFSLINNNRDWIKAPRGYNLSLGGRHKVKGGMFKSYLQHQSGNLELGLENLEDPNNPDLFTNSNSNTFWTSSYKGILGSSWSIFAALAYARDVDEDDFNQFATDEDKTWLQSKLTLGTDLNNKVYLKLGGELHYQQDKLFKGFDTGTFETEYTGTYTAFYAETDIQLSNSLALRLGGRGEYSAVIQEFNLAPRTSLAFKTGDNSQVSLAYGSFFQTPESEFLWSTLNLEYERAEHYLVNYQWLTEEYTLRIEAYVKDYDRLVKSLGNFEYNNAGSGRASGIDFFWRDKVTLSNLDYWITYSYVDSERDYRDFPVAATPSFVSDHTFNFIGNYEIDPINTRLGLSYTFASGRTYTDPNQEGFLNATTQPYHNISLNASYLTSIWANFAVIYASVRNPLGFEQVFGYTYSADGSQRQVINPTSRRAFFVGLFISLF